MPRSVPAGRAANVFAAAARKKDASSSSSVFSRLATHSAFSGGVFSAVRQSNHTFEEFLQRVQTPVIFNAKHPEVRPSHPTDTTFKLSALASCAWRTSVVRNNSLSSVSALAT